MTQPLYSDAYPAAFDPISSPVYESMALNRSTIIYSRGLGAAKTHSNSIQPVHPSGTKPPVRVYYYISLAYEDYPLISIGTLD